MVRLAHRFALIRLKQLVRSGKLHLHSFPLTLDAAAFDCVAEIFRRDEEGRFTELEEYFCEEKEPQNLSEEDAHYHFRVLVFSKLHDGIFRLYRENDPILSKILRNLKIALQKIESVRAFDRFGELYLCSCEEADRNDHLPEIPLEDLEVLLGSCFEGTENSRQYLEKVFDVLNTQTEYRRFYPLIGLSVIFKRLSVQRKTPVGTVLNIEDELYRKDIMYAVSISVDEAEKILRMRYVDSGKMSADSFDHWLSAIREMMLDTFASNDGTVQSHADYFLKYISTSDYETFRTKHRIQFEYMVKIAKRTVQRRLKELL